MTSAPTTFPQTRMGKYPSDSRRQAAAERLLLDQFACVLDLAFTPTVPCPHVELEGGALRHGPVGFHQSGLDRVRFLDQVF